MQADPTAQALAEAPKRLGEALIDSGRITEDQLSAALAKQHETGKFLGEILVEMGLVTEDELTPFLAKHCRIPYVSLLDYIVDESLLEFIPKELCLKHRILPVDKLGRNLTVALVNPLNRAALEEVRTQCEGLRVKPILCQASHFREVAEKLFNETGDKKGSGSLSLTSLGLGAAPSRPKPKAAPAAPPPEAPQQEAPPEQPAAPPEPGAAPADAAAPPDAPQPADEQPVDEPFNPTYEVLIRKIPLFKDLSTDEVDVVFASGATTETPAGAVLFRKGDTSTDLYVVLGGRVSIRDEAEELNVVESGDVFGEMALITGEPRTATAETLDTTSLFVINEDVFQSLLTKRLSIRLLLNMMERVAARLREVNQQLTPIITPEMVQAVARAQTRPEWEGVEYVAPGDTELLRGLSEAACNAIYASCAQTEIPAGAEIYSEGAIDRTLYVIERGSVRIRANGKDIALLTQGRMFGEMALATSRPRSGSAIAETDTRVFAMAPQTFEVLLRKQVSIQILMNMLVVICQRQKAANMLLRKVKG